MLENDRMHIRAPVPEIGWRQMRTSFQNILEAMFKAGARYEQFRDLKSYHS